MDRTVRAQKRDAPRASATGLTPHRRLTELPNTPHAPDLPPKKRFKPAMRRDRDHLVPRCSGRAHGCSNEMTTRPNRILAAGSTDRRHESASGRHDDLLQRPAVAVRVVEPLAGPEADRACRPGRGHLHKSQLGTDGLVVVDIPAKILAVELD